jgi:hypothetical protein
VPVRNYAGGVRHPCRCRPNAQHRPTRPRSHRCRCGRTRLHSCQ